MAAYVVMEKEGASDREPGSILFVRDGFHWPAFFVPILWLLWHRLWIEAALALGVTLLLSALGQYLGLGIYASLLALFVSLFFGLEGAALRLRALARRGWQERAVLEAPRLADAELLYFAAGEEADTEREPEPSPRALAASSATPRTGPAARSLGLVPYPGKP
jgi:hypothetical protein